MATEGRSQSVAHLLPEQLDVLEAVQLAAGHLAESLRPTLITA